MHSADCISFFILPFTYQFVLSINFVIMLESVIPFLREHWLVTLLPILIIYLAENWFHHGLYKYPGPFPASLTDWWRFFDVLGRRPDITHIRLHRQHGDIVRLGPNVLSFADPKALKTIYGLNKGFTKVGLQPWSKVSCSYPNSRDSTLYSKLYRRVLGYPLCSLRPTRNTMQLCGDV